MSVHAILFDVIGTTVLEQDPSVINKCFEEAFRDHGIPVSLDIIKANRGRDKREAISEILQQLDRPTRLCESILNAFIKNIETNLHNFSENPGLKETLQALRGRNIIIGVGTGLPYDIFQRIFDHLHWADHQFDYIGIAEKTGRGRPHPDMILDMMKIHSIAPSAFLKVGDTVADIHEGKNAGVRTVAILSGTTDEKELAMQRPDYIIRSLTELISACL